MQYYYLASTYGSGNYNTDSYSSTSSTGSNGGSSAGGTSSVLTDTGIALAAVVTLACLIALVALAVRVWKRPAAVPVQQSVDAEEPTESTQA